jgi:hypothetical protein
MSKKRKPPPTRHELNLGKKTKPSPTMANNDIKHQYKPKSLLSSALDVVEKVYTTIVKENEVTKCHLKNVEKELKDIKVKLQQRTFGMDVIKERNELCQHYTGFTDYDRLKICLKYLSVGKKGENVMMRGSTEKKGSGRPRVLSAEDQFLVMSMKLRNGFSNLHLGWLFNCDNTTISRIISSWLNYVYLKFCIHYQYGPQEKKSTN